MKLLGSGLFALLWAVLLIPASGERGWTGEARDSGKLGQVVIAHQPVKEQIGEEGVVISVQLSGEVPTQLTEMRLFYRVGEGPFQAILLEAAENAWRAAIPPQPRGTRVSYYLEATDPAGARITLPERAAAGHFYRLKFKGHAPLSLLVAHIGAMFAGALLFLRGAIFSALYLKNGARFDRIPKQVAWGTLLIFIGGFPLGMAMGYAVFGQPWTGLPIGGDVTDSKTLIVFVYWLVVVVLLKGTIFQGGRGKDWIGHRAFARLTILGSILTALIYLIPHSI